MVKTAVILAAGMGARLLERTKRRPKGLLVLDQKPIVEESVCKLLEAGMERIFIGTGYLAEAFERLALQYPQIRCVLNREYERTGSLYTLMKLKDWIADDFLLLESDLIYEKKALDTLIGHPAPDVILGGEPCRSNDEVFIETDERHLLVNLSKRREDLNRVYAEFVGITKISYGTFQAMCGYAAHNLERHPELGYEYALAGIAKNNGITVHKLNDLAWCEIDDEHHWHRAKHVIYPFIKAKETAAVVPVKRNILLNPGPATTTDTVKYAQIVPDICPREEEFGDVMQFISAELVRFVADPERYAAVLFGGSGTAAVESILSSVAGADAVLIVNNGAYGKRMCQIAEAYGLDYIEYQSASDEALDLASLEAAIRKSARNISHLAVVHSETSTGLLNDIGSIGRLCRTYRIHMIVDAMSSFGAIPIDMEAMNIGYLAASSNKNLQGMAGVGFVIARKELLETGGRHRPRNFYLDLYAQYKHFSETKQMRFTPPVQTLYALKQAIVETCLEGVPNRYERYSRSWQVLIDGITRLGLTHLVKKEHHSRIITAVLEPDAPGYDFKQMHDYFYHRGYTIYPGKLDGHRTFRVANIGDITPKDMESFVQLLEEYLISIGHGAGRSGTVGGSET